MARHQFELVANPSWAGRTPQHLTESACHDRSHCLDVRCNCGQTMHVHESQLAQLPKGSGVKSICKGCGDVLTFSPGFFAKGFADMRRQGWIV